MTYSKRQLYALGETLGDSVTQRKVGGGYVCGGGGGGGGFAGAIHAEPTSYTPSQGFVNQGKPAPASINPGPEAAPEPIAAQGVQSSFGSTTDASPQQMSQPMQTQNPFTGGLGGYGYRYGDSTQQPPPQQPQNPYGSFGGNPYQGNPYGNGNYGGGGNQQYGGLMGILQHLFGGQGYGQQPQPQQPQQQLAQQPPQMFPDVIQASNPLGGEYQ
jgi:hypothetical protein